MKIITLARSSEKIFNPSHYTGIFLITSERSVRSSYYQSYIGRFDVDGIKKTLNNFFLNRKKLKFIFMPILGLAESFKTREKPTFVRICLALRRSGTFGASAVSIWEAAALGGGKRNNRKKIFRTPGVPHSGRRRY